MKKWVYVCFCVFVSVYMSVYFLCICEKNRLKNVIRSNFYVKDKNAISIKRWLGQGENIRSETRSKIDIASKNSKKRFFCEKPYAFVKKGLKCQNVFPTPPKLGKCSA